MKTRFFSLRLTLTEYKALLKLAKYADLTPSSWFRGTILQAASTSVVGEKLARRLNAECRQYGLRNYRREAKRARAGGA